MDAFAASEIFAFENFRLDLRTGELLRQDARGSFVPVAIGSRALGVLAVLVARAGVLIPKYEIMEAVWPGATIEESNLSVQLSVLRRVLDADRVGGSCIQNVPGRGYRLVLPVTRLPPTEEIEPPAVRALSAAQAVAAEIPAPRRRTIAAVAGACLLAISSGAWWALHEPHPQRPAAYSQQDRRESVMVLPFENSSGDPAQDVLAADLTRSLTDTFATDATVPLVPPATAASYRGKAFDLRAIGRERDVNFVLTGHARRQDGRLIVAVTLFQACDERAVWAQQYDRPAQPDELKFITWNIKENFDYATIDAESARAMREHPADLDKRDLMFAASATSLAATSEKKDRARLALIERALALDPNYPWALGLDGFSRASLVLDGFSADPASDLAIADERVERALALAPNFVWLLRAKARVLRARGDLDGAASLIRKVIALQPGGGWRYRELGQILMAQGRHSEALESLSIARHLIPPTEDDKILDANIAAALVANDRSVEAIPLARLVVSEYSPDSGIEGEVPVLTLIAAESMTGRDAQARADLQRFLATPRSLRELGKVQKLPPLAANTRLLEGLRRAGMQVE